MKKLLAIILAMTLLFSLASCGKETEVVLVDDSVMMDVRSVGDVGETRSIILSFYYLYSGRTLPEFEIAEVQGENLDILSWTCEDISSDTYKTTQKDGYHLGSECIVISVDMTDLIEGLTLQIDAIELLINGEEQTLTFAYPLTYSASGDEETMNTEWLQPCAIACEAAIEGWVLFQYQAEEDIEVEGFSLGSYVSVDDFVVSIYDGGTGIEVMTGDMSSFPIALKQGQVISIEGTIMPENVSNYSGYQNIYTSAVLTYVYGGTECEQRYSFTIVSDPVSTGLTTVIEEMLSAQ